MKKPTDIFAGDFEIPGIVNERMEDAFAAVKKEENVSMENNTDNLNGKKKRTRWFKGQAAAVICICILALGGITVYAASHIWSRGMKGELRGTDALWQDLAERGIATIYSEAEDYEALSVTNNGVTVTPEMLVTSEKMLYLSFKVEGYDLEEGKSPCFYVARMYTGDDPDEGYVQIPGASFYDGLVTGEDGYAVKEDGSPFETDENGNLVHYYKDEDGNLEYIIHGMVVHPEDSFLGKTLHVKLANLGIGEPKAHTSTEVEGEWEFELEIPKVSMTEEIQIGKEVKGTRFVLDTLKISPVFAEVDFSVNGEVNRYDEEKLLGIPQFTGFVLKDGTRLEYILDGGMERYNADASERFEIFGFDRVIDPEQVSAVIVGINYGEEYEDIDIPIDR